MLVWDMTYRELRPQPKGERMIVTAFLAAPEVTGQKGIGKGEALAKDGGRFARRLMFQPEVIPVTNVSYSTK